MLALALCILAFVMSFWMGKRSLGAGLIALLAIGYFYGILRANLFTVYSHFIFDAGLIGLYLSQSWVASNPREAKRLETMRLWTAALLIWPVLMLAMPFQPFLVSIVGLRGNTFFLPILLLGSKLKEKDLSILSGGLAILNLIALGFATAEYFTDVRRFFPPSPVTAIIYSSGDVAGRFFRVPAIFTSAHAYGGTMAFTLPYVIGGWMHVRDRRLQTLQVLGIAAAMFGILLSATRQNFIFGSVMILFTAFTTHMKSSHRVIFVLMIAGIGWAAMSNIRFQRFKTLADTDSVVDRIAGSVNRGFGEILIEHPMGNGLGGGGTSIPFFLQGQVRNPIGMENGFALILCEQGVIGLLIWIAYILWFLSRVGTAFAKGPWENSRKMAWSIAAFSLCTAWIGTGTFTSIPSTVILMLSMGWTAIPAFAEAHQVGQRGVGKAVPKPALVA